MSETREQVPFGVDELQRAAGLAGREQTTHEGKLRILREAREILGFVAATHRWPTFRLKGDPAENRLTICLHRLVVRLARHDGYGAPADPMELAKAEEQARRRARAERPADPGLWDLAQDEPEGSA